MHSPFIFDFAVNVLYAKKHYYDFEKIDNLRQTLLEDRGYVSINDFGAGSYGTNGKRKKVNEIAKYSAKNSKYGELLFRLVNFLAPEKVLELGTSIGISGAYISAAKKEAKIVTIEANKDIADIAKRNFEFLKSKNIQVRVGTFEDCMEDTLKDFGEVDFVFFDGNHRKKPTLEYFYKCLEYKSERGVFVFDDIHWSSEMENAWREIIQHPSVTVSIDLFFLGIIFFRKEQAKQHFIIRF